ncbi:MAG TPA: CooT family nickel-binding protein [Dehalococcoidia bacterium]|nr:CooT family nickel-binding protein [Dehalococcoidia bacterium]
MCIATVYVATGAKRKEVMRDVVRIEVEDGRFRLLSLLGEEKWLGGRLKSIDFWEEHTVIIEQSE